MNDTVPTADSDDEIQPDWTPNWSPLGRLRLPVGDGPMVEKYRELREKCPVAYAGGQPFRRGYCVMKYSDIVSISRDPVTYVNEGTQAAFTLPALGGPAQFDGERHLKLKKVLQPFFRPGRVKALVEPIARKLYRETIRALVDQGGGDVGTKVVDEIPVQVALAFYNQPIEGWKEFKEAAETRGKAIYTDADKPEKLAERMVGVRALDGYMWNMVQERDSAGTPVTEDIVAAMAKGLRDGSLYNSDDEFLASLGLLLHSGFSTTSRTMLALVTRLAGDQEMQSRLRAEPALVTKYVEEGLRFYGTVPLIPRMIARDVEVRGKKLKAGTEIQLCYPSANRDEEVFERPDEFSIDRARNVHLSFGVGIHSCLGAPLARLQLNTCIEELLAATSSFSPAEGEPDSTGVGYAGGAVSDMSVFFRMEPARS